MATPEFLTTKELSSIVRTHERRLMAWRYRGEGPAFIKLSNRKILYRRADVEAWLEQHRHGEAA